MHTSLTYCSASQAAGMNAFVPPQLDFVTRDADGLFVVGCALFVRLFLCCRMSPRSSVLQPASPRVLDFAPLCEPQQTGPSGCSLRPSPCQVHYPHRASRAEFVVGAYESEEETRRVRLSVCAYRGDAR